MADYRRDGGVFKPAISRARKHSSIWKPPTQLSVRDSGIWKPVLPTGDVIDGVDLVSTGSKSLRYIYPQTVTTDPEKGTFSVWYERNTNSGASSAYKNIILSSLCAIVHDADGVIVIYLYEEAFNWSCSMVSSDTLLANPAGPVHVMLTVDTTQATAADRLRAWVDGSEITSWDTDNRSNIVQNGATGMFGSTLTTATTVLGAGGTVDCDGIVGEAVAIDGISITDPTVFEEVYDGDLGPRGFHYDFSDPDDLGKDIGANGLDATLTNVSSSDHVDAWHTIT